MLTTARCPECGLSFNWQAIIRQSAIINCGPSRFEYEWRTRPFSSFFATIARTLLFWRLWKQMPLESPPNIWALVLLIPLTAVCMTLISLIVGNLTFWNWLIYQYGAQGSLARSSLKVRTTKRLHDFPTHLPFSLACSNLAHCIHLLAVSSSISDSRKANPSDPRVDMGECRYMGRDF